MPGTGLTGVKTPVGMWGYSGGGLATSWAAELQPGYAPELHVAGVASGGTPADMVAAARRIDGTIASGLVLLASTGLTRAYPEMLSLLNDKGRAMVNEIGDMCIGDAVSRFPFRHLDEFTVSPGSAVGAGGRGGDGGQPPRPAERRRRRSSSTTRSSTS